MRLKQWINKRDNVTNKWSWKTAVNRDRTFYKVTLSTSEAEARVHVQESRVLRITIDSFTHSFWASDFLEVFADVIAHGSVASASRLAARHRYDPRPGTGALHTLSASCWCRTQNWRPQSCTKYTPSDKFHISTRSIRRAETSTKAGHFVYIQVQQYM